MARGPLSYHAVPDRHGPMICAACGKPITEGQYRVRELSDRFVTHHRACVADDPEWAAMDKRADEWRSAYDAMQADVQALLRKWDGKFDPWQIAEAASGESA